MVRCVPFSSRRICLEAAETDVPIKVGKPNCNIAALTAEFGEELVGKARRACSILVSQISERSLVELILEAGSPSEGWSIFKSHYAPRSAAEKARVTQAWYFLRMKDGESPNEYFAKGGVLHSQLGSHEMAFQMLMQITTLPATSPTSSESKRASCSPTQISGAKSLRMWY